ncbi:MAG: hypothetical protein RLZZ500_1438 [Bacteroidota bacterium]|jgi:SAM-dependent methyltransferase
MKMKLNKDYWQNRYENNEIGWDTGSITQPLKEYIDQLTTKDLRILIPGAGNGHELEYLHQQGFQKVHVVDYAAQPLENIKKRMPQIASEQLIQADFFEHEGTYDLIIEQTFYCALDPELRDNYVRHMHHLLAENGKLIGLLFQFPLTEVGPPFGGSKEEYVQRFSSLFDIKTLETAHNSIPPRQGNELFFIFSKK